MVLLQIVKGDTAADRGTRAPTAGARLALEPNELHARAEIII